MGFRRETVFSALLDEMLAAAEERMLDARHAHAAFDPLAGLAAAGPEMAERRQSALAGDYMLSEPEQIEDDESALPIDLEAIRAELGLVRPVGARELDRRRRDFAFHNHPDRVAAHLRSRAEIRMRIANALIDQAKQALPVRPVD